ncbi:MAG TPA: Hsp70 family protein, partial [Bacteroidia bacterium]|nr:Hsp70 family protein [Bacteroidia bacterium]
PQNQPDHSNLSKEIVKMKRLLSKKDSHTLRLHTANCPIEFPCSLGEFEEFIQMELDQAFQCLAKWEQKARNAGKSAGKVLLVGGTSQIPAVARRLEQTGMRPIRWTEGMRAVALGAALHARLASAGGPTKSDPKFSAMQEYRRLLEAVRSGKALGQEECLRLRQEAAALALTETEALAMEMQIIGKPLPATGHRPNTSPRQKPVSGSVDVSFAKPEYGMFIRISDRSSATAPNAFESTHFPFGYDVLITNNSSQPVTHVSVRITRAGIPGSETNVVARILDPDERVRLTMLDLDWYLQAGDVVEVNWNGAATPLWRAVEEADCGPSELPILPIAATWSKGAFSGKVLQIWCLEGGGMGALTVQTQAGGKATLASVPYGRWLPVGWMEFSDSKNIADSDVIEFSSPGFSPAIGIIVP